VEAEARVTILKLVMVDWAAEAEVMPLEALQQKGLAALLR
jgi:hypothetical protein